MQIGIRFFLTFPALLLLMSCGSGSQDHENTNNSSIDFQPDMAIVEKWKHLKIIDVHNHDAAGSNYKKNKPLFDRYYIDKIVLFGDISDPAAIASDAVSWTAYQEDPARIIPFFSGFEMYEPKGIERAINNLEKGYFGVGETVAASYYSPVASKAKWKAAHPMDGNLPQIYQLCADYQVPILLHIDPLDGPPELPMQKLEEALQAFPNTHFILGHGNAYNPPDNIEHLLKTYNNIYIDFFAGFSRYNPESAYTLSAWVPLIKQYPDRFMVSTDSGYGLGEDRALYAIYELIDLIDDESVATKVAHENILELIKYKR